MYSFSMKWIVFLIQLSLELNFCRGRNTLDGLQRRNDASRSVWCTNISKQFICWLLMAFCVCSAVCTLIRCAALVYSTRLSSHSPPMFHNKTLFQKCVTLKLNTMLDFYLNGGRGEWFSVCQDLKMTLARCASAMWFYSWMRDIKFSIAVESIVKGEPFPVWLVCVLHLDA